MKKKIAILLVVPLFLVFSTTHFMGRNRVKHSQGDDMYGRGFGRGGGRGLGRGFGRGPFRDGRGPNPDCPVRNGSQATDEKTQQEREDSGRTLRRDGSGPNKVGQGPRGSNLGPKEDCPKK